jgi:carbamate kinase
MFILTDVNQVAINFNTPSQKFITRMTVTDAKKFLNEGHFPPGSMGPKIESAIRFLESGGEKVFITSLELVKDALEGKNGTIIEK